VSEPERKEVRPFQIGHRTGTRLDSRITPPCPDPHPLPPATKASLFRSGRSLSWTLAVCVDVPRHGMNPLAEDRPQLFRHHLFQGIARELDRSELVRIARCPGAPRRATGSGAMRAATNPSAAKVGSPASSVPVDVETAVVARITERSPRQALALSLPPCVPSSPAPQTPQKHHQRVELLSRDLGESLLQPEHRGRE
jgi:hypothetical protein